MTNRVKPKLERAVRIALISHLFASLERVRDILPFSQQIEFRVVKSMHLRISIVIVLEEVIFCPSSWDKVNTAIARPMDNPARWNGRVAYFEPRAKEVKFLCPEGAASQRGAESWADVGGRGLVTESVERWARSLYDS